ncbi:hypothetical protein [Actinomadura hibisca]|uniref:hypothetical protein n=1 Tax=Actinomadura hibisca TaxID=68565 RepID=UPI000ABAD723|nr:hypothetical protein [Actinomadura hibisca]
MKSLRNRRRLVFAVVVVIGGGWLAYTAIPDRFGEPAASGSTSASKPALQSSPPTTLKGLSWQDFHGIQLPHAPDDGPRLLRNDLAEGFTRTPRGALLAAVHIVVRANAQWGPKVFEPTIAHQVTGPDAKALLKLVGETYNDQQERARLSYGAPLGRGHVVIEGFRWLGYTPEAASLDLVSAGPGESDVTVRAATRIQVQWHDGDWRVLAPIDGTWGGSAAPIKSPDGYTALQGGS